jgi:hypothetical protein
MLAADVTAREREPLAQKIDERRACIDPLGHLLAVYLERNLMETFFHARRSRVCGAVSCFATRRSRTPARCSFTAAEA